MILARLEELVPAETVLTPSTRKDVVRLALFLLPTPDDLVEFTAWW
jgi:hypothetical protein